MPEINFIAVLEAVLFASGEPVSMDQLKEILSLEEAEVQQLTEKLGAKLTQQGSGLQLRQVAGGWQLVTRAEHYGYVKKLTETRDKKLSSAAMETLSIIAFKQPITKQEIEHIRGVRIEKVMVKLLELELIRELGRRETLGRPILYGTTDVFLKCFGLNELTDLPDLPAPAEQELNLDADLDLEQVSRPVPQEAQDE